MLSRRLRRIGGCSAPYASVSEGIMCFYVYAAHDACER